MFKIIYRVWGTYTFGKLKGQTNPKAHVDVIMYTRGGHDGGVNMKEVKGHIRKEIGDCLYQFTDIVRLHADA